MNCVCTGVAERLAETDTKASGIWFTVEEQKDDKAHCSLCVEVIYPMLLTKNACRRVLRVKNELKCTVYENGDDVLIYLV